MRTIVVLAIAAITSTFSLSAQAQYCPTWRCGFNGVSMNGIKLQGWHLNGIRFNGANLNGVVLNGGADDGSDEPSGPRVDSVTLPDGSTLKVR